MRVPNGLQKLTRELVECRLPLSLGLSASCGLLLQSLYPINESDPLLRLIAIERPVIYQGLTWSYALFLYTTPFLVSSILFSLAYVHFYAPDLNQNAGRLPDFPIRGCGKICSWSSAKSTTSSSRNRRLLRTG